ncbi:phage integrase N-terminal SAM-like domain-containing protein [Streptococcus sp. ZJ93]|uniref:phage integrase N-terminal SAM-like domain-containing protein n=1 Tax=Streptococcus handemini TaxID=3161188 RepID=UPI0032ED39AD
MTNNRTRTTYKRSINRFSQWAKDHNLKKKEEITEEVIQAYHNDLSNDPREYTAATIHTYLAPICKASDINMNRIRKHKRTSDKIIRGRKRDKNAQGKRQENDSRFSRVIDFQKAVGIRRSELKELTGGDLKKDVYGNYYVIVKRGKGGKYQEQLILPQDVPVILKTFQNITRDKKVFSEQEMNNLINFHGMRAQHARDCYFYFLDKIQRNENYARSLKRQLINFWEIGHQKLWEESNKKFVKQRNTFIYDLRDEAYKLRGANYKKALQTGMPTTYNRLALMAVSVLNLSHWRLSVTITNYIL